ncbi:MAG TPA: phosphoribosylformylglycinamidine synthase subunit PurS [Actinomycetota bacterium]|jgi:phosphoribosylformylglycinamidine synthase|nr:phosphoribosylformylglycinamidine synthase subunit PurS [Actinomycetota bacterium]
MTYSARVDVMLKNGIADPQGQTIERALPALGYEGVGDVRVGKLIELTLDAPDADEARRRVLEMCGKLLANPVIESFEVTIR